MEPRIRKHVGCPKLATGEMVAALAMTEPGAGSDVQSVRTSAAKNRERIFHQRLKDFYYQRSDSQPHLPCCQDGQGRRCQWRIVDHG